MNEPFDDSDLPDDEAFAEFDAFIASIVTAAVRGMSLANLYGLAEVLGSDLTQTLPDAPEDEQAQHALARQLARQILDQTPLPEQRFALRRRQRPERNALCDCGSGRKYKHCCLRLEGQLPNEPMNLLPYVLDALPRKRWAELVGSAVDPQAVVATAVGFLEEDKAGDAVALLEPWFKDQARIDGTREDLLDALLDAYSALGQERKKQRLLQHALAHGDHAIRSSVHQRLATMTADDGDFEAAWKHFRDAQRENADAASLAHLEIVLLIAQHRGDEARERARFWIARLLRADAVGHADIIDFLRNVVDHGEQALLDVQAERWPELAELRELLAAAPAPAIHHQLHKDMLAPDRELAKALKAWGQAFPQVGPALTSLVVEDHPAWEDPQRWLDCLRGQPLLWQSFDVLDDLVLALSGIYEMGMAPLVEAMTERGEALLRLQLAEHDGAPPELEWGCMENRPALRLLAQRIALAPQPPDADTQARMQWMLALNYGDNHGYRNELAAAWLAGDDTAKALALIERYPDDAELAFAKVLALYALGRQEQALEALGQAHAVLPRIAPMLAAAKPRKPKMSSAWVTWGGEDQAWQHRETWLPAWQRHEGTLPWLRKALRTLPSP
ncbi:MAG: SEC-C domain-containing protein [Pseudoxanthomonas sp.]